MSIKRPPETDVERIDILRAALEQDELTEAEDKVISIMEVQALRNFLTSFEGANFNLKQAIIDKKNAIILYEERFKNVQLYISHFIQVLFMTVFRNEIRSESLPLYGFRENNPELPDLSTEEALLKWGEKLMLGETERMYRGGIPLYNPAIAKVKVHYELFKEAIYSLAIYEKNITRLGNNMSDLRTKADELILDIWDKVEKRYSRAPLSEQNLQFKAYKIQFSYRKGEQLNVFD